ncbi:hypothetical protein RRG08_017468 [Elysia crispata]|uniref:Uncharacterized protein n=1 Tax=Elysia crispata TaxID=231223 RepID=A0AAE1CYY7_9GAST|nr:hypothetical protein RRG08_017468 [Elysia crispata]
MQRGDHLAEDRAGLLYASLFLTPSCPPRHQLKAWPLASGTTTRQYSSSRFINFHCFRSPRTCKSAFSEKSFIVQGIRHTASPYPRTLTVTVVVRYCPVVIMTIRGPESFTSCTLSLPFGVLQSAGIVSTCGGLDYSLARHIMLMLMSSEVTLLKHVDFLHITLYFVNI